MEKSQHDGKQLAVRTRFLRLFKNREAGNKAEEDEVETSTRSRPSRSKSRRDLSHGASSSEDDLDPRPRRRGHTYRHIQARENSRMHLGDNTYIATQNVYHAPADGQNGKQLDLLEALAFEHMGTRQVSISTAQDQTGRWLFDTDEYTRWRGGVHSSRYRFLWIKGKPGSGKSTLMKTALQHAPGDFKHSVLASFFFNARGAGTSKTTEGMYRTLLHQIFSQLPALPPGIPSNVASVLKQKGFEVPMLQNMMRTTVLHLSRRQSLVCYIDALDECAEDDIRDALRHFEELRDLAMRCGKKFLVCFASRHYPDITIRHHQEVNIDERVEHSHDISNYIDSALVIPDELGAELHDALLARCGGVFLWVVLTVKSLNKMYDQGGTRSQLRARVRDTPSKIQDLFREIMQDRDEYLVPTLTWILFAHQLLNVPQLYFAVKASAGPRSTGYWNRSEIDPSRMKKFLLASSKGLIEFVGASDGVFSYAQLIHESLREYLLDGGLVGLDAGMGVEVSPISHARLAAWCVEYIAADSERYMAGDFQRIQTKSAYCHNAGLPLFEYVVMQTADHIAIALADNAIPDSTLERFTNMWLTCKLDTLNGQAGSDCAALLYYSLLRQGDTCGRSMLGGAVHHRLGSKPIYEFSDYLKTDEVKKRWLTFRTAAQAGSVDLPQLFFDRSHSSDFNRTVQIALFQADAEGQEHILDLLLHYLHPGPDWQLCHALLRVAATNLHEGTARVMLQYGTHPNAPNPLIPSVLRGVARNDDPPQCEGDPVRMRINITTMLLDHGANTKGALLSAGKAGRLELMQLLTARGATFSRSEIRTARERGRYEILDMAHVAGAPVGDSASESAYTSESAASNAAVMGD